MQHMLHGVLGARLKLKSALKFFPLCIAYIYSLAQNSSMSLEPHAWQLTRQCSVRPVQLTQFELHISCIDIATYMKRI
jgi:hypothetical protein